MKTLELTDVGKFTGNLIESTQALAQRIRIELKTFLGEWVLDESLGIPYFEEVLVRNANPLIVENIIRRALLRIPGVGDISQLEVTIDRRSRRVITNFTVTTDQEELLTLTVNLSENLEIA